MLPSVAAVASFSQHMVDLFAHLRLPIKPDGPVQVFKNILN